MSLHVVGMEVVFSGRVLIGEDVVEQEVRGANPLPGCWDACVRFDELQVRLQRMDDID